jgi:Uma2 family endonuclease
MTLERTKITIDEYEQFLALPENHDKLLELIDGEIVEKMVTFKHGEAVLNIAFEIKLYFRQNKIGRIATEARHRPSQDRLNDRLPDISVVIGSDKVIPDSGAVLFMPDLAVEVKSPDDTYKMLRDKARFYLANGARMVWLVFPEKQIVEVYTPAEEQILREGDTLTGGDVLPGFSMAVSQIFEM